MNNRFMFHVSYSIITHNYNMANFLGLLIEKLNNLDNFGLTMTYLNFCFVFLCNFA